MCVCVCRGGDLGIGFVYVVEEGGRGKRCRIRYDKIRCMYTCLYGLE